MRHHVFGSLEGPDQSTQKQKEHLPKSHAHADEIWSAPRVMEMTTVKALANEALTIHGSKDNPKLSTPISLFRTVARRKGNIGNRSPALAGGTAFLKFCQFWEPKCSNFIGLGFGSGGGGWWWGPKCWRQPVQKLLLMKNRAILQASKDPLRS